VSLPVFQSSTFEYTGQSSYDDLKYIRMNNTPNHEVLHEKLATLENAEAALVTASGMAAISTTLLALFSPGDHILVQDCLYGGTQDFIASDFAPLGFQFDFIDGDDPASWTKKLKPNTRGLYVETITNPLLQVADLSSLIRVCQGQWPDLHDRQHLCHPGQFSAGRVGLRHLPAQLHQISQRPFRHRGRGGDRHGGAGEKNRPQTDSSGRQSGSPRLLSPSSGDENPGFARSPPEPQRPGHCRIPAGHPAIDRVNYPGLPDHPGHDRAEKLLEGFGGMVSFELKGGLQAAEQFMQRTTIPIVAPSLGGVETLVTRPATTSHAGMSAAERQAAGINDALIRLSVGIEDDTGFDRRF
jgi:cystathionine beta-lyase/cystathionine gamma-synthase